MSSQLPQQRLTVPAEVNEDEFYTLESGKETLVTHADLEEAVENEEKPYLREVQRYWVNQPYAFVVIYRNIRDNELRYIVVEPRLSGLEHDIVNFFRDKLRTSLNYERVDIDSTPAQRSRIVRDETFGLMKRYNLLQDQSIDNSTGLVNRFKKFVIEFLERQADRIDSSSSVTEEAPTPRDPNTGEIQTINETQVRRVLYYLVRDFIRFDKIDPVKQDVNIEDISCDGYNSTVFVYHSEYGQQIISNIGFGVDDLDSFVKTLAQSAGKGISRRQPSVDATLADGSRAQMTLGTETSDRGTNFTIRQFNEIPFTPIDLINWKTFDIDMMAYLWLAIEQNKSIVFAGGTASGKTTTLNAVSLFMPSTAKIVSIEDTRELEIPQANWIPRTTRESFQQDGSGSIDEFDLLEDALRQRPDYVIMGEVRGEEGQTLFQMLNTGHTTYTTFHANKPREVVRRFITDPINVSPSMFDALDIICQQESVDIDGQKVRRGREIVEVNDYSASTEQFSMNNAFGWSRKTDSFRRQGRSNILEEIKDENAWDDNEIKKEWNHRRLVLAYLVKNNINTYAGVAATIQGYMSSKDTILGLITDDELKKRTAALHKMKTINIDVDPEKEALIPRPMTPSDVDEKAGKILRDTESLLVGYDSTEVDFAQTIDDMLTGEDGLSESDEEIIRELGEGGVVGELPEGVDPSMSDSSSVSGTGMAGVEFDEELEDLFEDDESQIKNEGDQLILTSENLEKLNESGPRTTSDKDTKSDSDMGDLDDFFQENKDGDPMPIDDGGNDDDGTAEQNDTGEPDVMPPVDGSNSNDDTSSTDPDSIESSSSNDGESDDVKINSDGSEVQDGSELDDPLDGEEKVTTVSLEDTDNEETTGGEATQDTEEGKGKDSSSSSNPDNKEMQSEE